MAQFTQNHSNSREFFLKHCKMPIFDEIYVEFSAKNMSEFIRLKLLGWYFNVKIFFLGTWCRNFSAKKNSKEICHVLTYARNLILRVFSIQVKMNDRLSISDRVISVEITVIEIQSFWLEATNWPRFELLI